MWWKTLGSRRFLPLPSSAAGEVAHGTGVQRRAFRRRQRRGRARKDRVKMGATAARRSLLVADALPVNGAIALTIVLPNPRRQELRLLRRGELGDVDRRRRLQHRELAQPLGRELAGERIVDARHQVAQRRQDPALLVLGVVVHEIAELPRGCKPRATSAGARRPALPARVPGRRARRARPRPARRAPGSCSRA